MKNSCTQLMEIESSIPVSNPGTYSQFKNEKVARTMAAFFVGKQRKLVLVLLFLLFTLWTQAATYFLTTAGQATASTVGNWNTGGIGGGGTAATVFTNAGDIWVISS